MQCSREVSSARETNKSKKVTSKLENMTEFYCQYVTFGFATMIVCKRPECEKTIFESFFCDFNNGHFCPCPNSKGDIFQSGAD